MSSVDHPLWNNYNFEKQLAINRNLPLTTSSKAAVAEKGLACLDEIAVHVYWPLSPKVVFKIFSWEVTLLRPVTVFSWALEEVTTIPSENVKEVFSLLHVMLGAGRAVAAHVRMAVLNSFTESTGVGEMIAGLTKQKRKTINWRGSPKALQSFLCSVNM